MTITSDATIPPQTMNLGPLILPAPLRLAHLRAMAAHAAYGRTPIYDQLAAEHAHWPGRCTTLTCGAKAGQPCRTRGEVREEMHVARQRRAGLLDA